MTPSEINDIANFIVLGAVIPFALFSITYGTRDSWYQTYLGVTIWGLVTSQAVVLAVIILRRWFGDYPGHEWVAIVVYSLLTIFAWLFYVIYLVERRRSSTLAIPLTRHLYRKKGKK